MASEHWELVELPRNLGIALFFLFVSKRLEGGVAEDHQIKNNTQIMRSCMVRCTEFHCPIGCLEIGRLRIMLPDSSYVEKNCGVADMTGVNNAQMHKSNKGPK